MKLLELARRSSSRSILLAVALGGVSAAACADANAVPTGDGYYPYPTATSAAPPSDPDPGASADGGDTRVVEADAASPVGRGKDAGSDAAPAEAGMADAGGPSTPPLSPATDPAVAQALATAGLDVNLLPFSMSELTAAERLAVMKSFNLALGVACTGCHASTGGVTDFAAETPNVKVTRKMWTEYVSGLTRTNGAGIYCDTCHTGKAQYLERADHGKLVSYMKTDLIAKLTPFDGSASSCATCHGTPFVGAFLAGWRL